jgi:hypothetical protein
VLCEVLSQVKNLEESLTRFKPAKVTSLRMSSLKLQMVCRMPRAHVCPMVDYSSLRGLILVVPWRCVTLLSALVKNAFTQCVCNQVCLCDMFCILEL